MNKTIVSLAAALMVVLVSAGAASAAGSSTSSSPQTVKIGAGYAGRFRITPELVLEITVVDGHAFAQLTGQDRFEIFPTSATDFYWKVVDASLTFTLDAKGSASGIVLHQNGQDIPGERLADTTS